MTWHCGFLPCPWRVSNLTRRARGGSFEVGKQSRVWLKKKREIIIINRHFTDKKGSWEWVYSLGLSKKGPRVSWSIMMCLSKGREVRQTAIGLSIVYYWGGLTAAESPTSQNRTDIIRHWRKRYCRWEKDLSSVRALLLEMRRDKDSHWVWVGRKTPWHREQRIASWHGVIDP